MQKFHSFIVLAGFLLAVACDDDTSGNNSPVTGPVNTSHVSVTNITVPDRYEFTSKLTATAGESSVSYGGQSHRQVLISDLSTYLTSLKDEANSNANLTSVDVLAVLESYFDYDPEIDADINILIDTNPAPKQDVLGDMDDDSLVGKIAGNDAEGQHKDWSTDFIGWVQTGVDTPESLVRTWFDEVAARVEDHALNGAATTVVGNTEVTINDPVISKTGLNYQQLLAKFIAGAVAYSQGTDDYLDTDTEGKGTLASNIGSNESPYTGLEHAWDEGFGYFGAARDYIDYTDDEIAGKDGRNDYKNGYHDTDGDGAIDLNSEINFGHSTNAAKRDRGSQDGSKTDYTKGAWDAFVTGRTLMAAIISTPTAAQQAEIDELADAARLNWELAIAATVVHYINDTLGDVGTLKTNDTLTSTELADYAKHWSELKGFALALQFNPVKQISDADLQEVHDLIGQAPVLATGTTLTNYESDLLSARDLMKEAYGDDNGFTTENVENW